MVTLALVEGHLKRVGGECSREDMSGGELVPKVGSAVGRGHQCHDHGLIAGIDQLRELLLLTNPLAIGGVGFGHA